MTRSIVNPLPGAQAPHDCGLCPRMVAFREKCRTAYPDWWNAPLSAFGDPAAQIVLVDQAPEKHGGNRTGRPMTGDFGGKTFFAMLEKHGLARGTYDARVDDELELLDCMILSSVKCVPPQIKITPEENRTCRQFLKAEVAMMPNARIFVAFGPLAHQSTVKTLGGKLPKAQFGHLAEHRMPDGRIVLDSEQCWRQNMTSGRLTEDMLDAVFARAVQLRGQA